MPIIRGSRTDKREPRIARKPVNPLLIMAASLLLGATALAVAYGMYTERLELLQQGRQTDGVIVGINVGVRGIKSVEAAFIAADGRRLVGRDIHKTQWFAANGIGDEVLLYYDLNFEGAGKPDILIERGVWIWFNPVILLGGGILLLWLGIYLARQQQRRGKGE